MNHYSIDVFGLGQCALDYLGKLDHYPPPDVKCSFTDLVVQGGGPVATALVALSRWGLSCSFAGVIGSDSFGSDIRISLEKEGVDTQGLLVREGADSQFSFIVAEPSNNGRRTIFTRKPTGAYLRPEEIDCGGLEQARVFHTDGLFVEASLAGADVARKAGVPVVVDAGSLRDGMVELAQKSAFFLASQPFAASLMGKDAPVDACYRLAELGPKVVTVTLGDQGYVALVEGALIEKPAYDVEAIDTTGCGDVFHAGFTFGLVKNWAVEKSLDFAAWAASRVALKLGGRAGIPGVQEWPERYMD